MTMKFVKIDEKQWAEGIGKLKSGYRVFGPVKEGKDHEFRELTGDASPDMAFSNTRLSPKSVVYPQSEVMFEYTTDESRPDHHILKEPRRDDTPRAVIGIRPCDALSFLLVRRNFDSPEYKDPYWLRNYEATTFVGYGCNDPCATCFCTSAGSAPHDTQGLDALVVDRDGGYAAKAITEKGEALMKAAGWTDAMDEAEAEALFADRAAAAEKKITRQVATDKLAEKPSMDLYDAPFWEDVAFSCINCGTCTYLCPTCWCFDIQDECRGCEGVRTRNWDSCMAPLFTAHGSGHNPRGEKVQRVRQRFMHKLKYYVDKYGEGIQCVGCGRCVRSCPVNIDIRKVCDMMNAYDPEAANDCACPTT